MTLTATTTHWPTASKTGSSDRHHPDTEHDHGGVVDQRHEVVQRLRPGERSDIGVTASGCGLREHRGLKDQAYHDNYHAHYDRRYSLRLHGFSSFGVTVPTPKSGNGISPSVLGVNPCAQRILIE